jgi:hypothetical protein
LFLENLKILNFYSIDSQVHKGYKFKNSFFCVGKNSKLFSVLILTLLLGSVINLPNAAAITCDSPTDIWPISACTYVSEDPFLIIDGLPNPQEIEIEIIALSLHSVTILPNGGAGEQKEQAMATLDMIMTGTGGLAYNRHLQMPISFEARTDARTLGTTPQSFDTEMWTLQGQLPPGDPDFDLLRITAGTGFGLPSPGHTTLTKNGPSDWAVDSFFDITYRIDFVGNPGGPFAGKSGSTTGTERILSNGSSDLDGIQPLCPPDTTLTGGTLDGVPGCAAEPTCPDGNDLVDGLCQPDDTEPSCPPDTFLDFDICIAPSTCPSGTTLNLMSLLCELTEQPTIGGTIIPIDTTSLLLAGAQSTSWLIPVVLSIAGIGMFVVSRKPENS